MVSPLVLLSQVGVIVVLCVLGAFVFRHRGRTRPGQLLALFCFLYGGWIAIQAGDCFRRITPGFRCSHAGWKRDSPRSAWPP